MPPPMIAGLYPYTYAGRGSAATPVHARRDSREPRGESHLSGVTGRAGWRPGIRVLVHRLCARAISTLTT